jgi:hypothetical protein
MMICFMRETGVEVKVTLVCLKLYTIVIIKDGYDLWTVLLLTCEIWKYLCKKTAAYKRIYNGQDSVQQAKGQSQRSRSNLIVKSHGNC